MRSFYKKDSKFVKRKIALKKNLKKRKKFKEKTKKNNYEYCFSHMSAIMMIASYPVLLNRKIKSIFWYTHAGPKNLFNKFEDHDKKMLSFEVLNKMIFMGASFKCYEPSNMKIIEIDYLKTFQF